VEIGREGGGRGGGGGPGDVLEEGGGLELCLESERTETRRGAGRREGGDGVGGSPETTGGGGGGEVTVRCGYRGGEVVAARSMRRPTEEGGRPGSDVQNRSRRARGARGSRAGGGGRPAKRRTKFFS
jgi:hypothetical protein